MGGKGKIFLSRGVAGNLVDKRHADGAMSVFKKYPGIRVVAEYYSNWNDRTTQQDTANAPAAHLNVDGIWAQAGKYGAIQALMNKGTKLAPTVPFTFRVGQSQPRAFAKSTTFAAGAPVAIPFNRRAQASRAVRFSAP
jgi:ribose transport system substrate-binding protein